MLDVHPMHHAAQGWRDFVVHIATITVGLLIAIGLEQTVEYFHRQHQVAQMKDSLREEGKETQAVVAADIRQIDTTVAKLDIGIGRLQTSKSIDAPAEIVLITPGNSAWSAARDSGLLSVAPRVLVDNYWKVYFLQEATVLQIRASYADLDNLQAMASVYPDAAIMPPDSREKMLVGFASYREKLKVLKIDLGLLSKISDLAINDRKIDTAPIYKQ